MTEPNLHNMERAHILAPPVSQIDIRHNTAWAKTEVTEAVNALVRSIVVFKDEDTSMSMNVRTLLRTIWNADTSFITEAADSAIAKSNFDERRKNLSNVLKKRVEDAFWFQFKQQHRNISASQLDLLVAESLPHFNRYVKQVEDKVRYESNIYIIEELVNTGLVDQDKILPLLLRSKLMTWTNKMTVPRSPLWLSALTEKSTKAKTAVKMMMEINSVDNSLDASDIDEPLEPPEDVERAGARAERTASDVRPPEEEFIVDITQKIIEEIQVKLNYDESFDWDNVCDVEFFMSILQCDIVNTFLKNPKKRSMDNASEPNTKRARSEGSSPQTPM